MHKIYKPVYLNIMLIEIDQSGGKFLKANFGARFTYTLLNNDLNLKPGDYLVMIDPHWEHGQEQKKPEEHSYTDYVSSIFGYNSEPEPEPPKTTADNDPLYRDVILDIYATEQVEIEQVYYDYGLETLEAAFLKIARRMRCLNKGDPYLQAEYECYGSDVVRIIEFKSLKCRYGFVYTRNGSPYQLYETLTLDLEGLEIVYPYSIQETQELHYSLEPEQDFIVILRIIDNDYSCTPSYEIHFPEPEPYYDEEVETPEENNDEDFNNEIDY